jgi:hypothetical protein
MDTDGSPKNLGGHHPWFVPISIILDINKKQAPNNVDASVILVRMWQWSMCWPNHEEVRHPSILFLKNGTSWNPALHFVLSWFVHTKIATY